VRGEDGQLTTTPAGAAEALASSYAATYTPRDVEACRAVEEAVRPYTEGVSVREWVDRMAALHWSGTRAAALPLNEVEGHAPDPGPQVTAEEVAAACKALRKGTACDAQGVRSDYLVDLASLHELIVIVIVINVLFAAHTHVSMARPSLAHSLVVYPRPVTCRCGVSGDTYHAPAFSTRQSPVSTLVYSPQGAHWHPAASVGCRWFWRAPGLY